jgi:hypothetical protein
METSHRHVGDGSLHRKCFIVSVENLRCSIMKKKFDGGGCRLIKGSGSGESEMPIGRATAPRTFLESTPAILRACANWSPSRPLQSRTRTRAQPRTQGHLPSHPQAAPAHTPHTQPPSMDSESEHEHRDDESVSEQEEIEEAKPKPALKKTREAAPPVERPELP